MRTSKKKSSRVLATALIAAAVLSADAGPPRLAASSTALEKGQFLIAGERLTDPNFAKTVVLLLHHDRGGAMGLIINRPTEMELSTLMPELEGVGDHPHSLYFGGPVGLEQILLLMRSADQPEDATEVFADVWVSGSRTLLEGLIRDRSGSLRLYAGYAGWAPGQLENESERGDWRVVPGDTDSIFDRRPTELWRRLSSARLAAIHSGSRRIRLKLTDRTAKSVSANPVAFIRSVRLPDPSPARRRGRHPRRPLPGVL